MGRREGEERKSEDESGAEHLCCWYEERERGLQRERETSGRVFTSWGMRREKEMGEDARLYVFAETPLRRRGMDVTDRI